jgi:hypothetical protein
MANSSNQNYEYIDRPYGVYMDRSTINIGDPTSSTGNVDTSSGNSLTNNSGSTEETDGTIDNGSVETQPVKSDGGMADLWINNMIRSTNWKPKKVGFYIDGQTGYAEFTNVYVSGNIQALTGLIGGWTIGPDSLYGTTTGIIKTGATVGIGSNGVIMDIAGLRGYDSVLGLTFNLPTDGSAPTFASGVINYTTFNVNTNAVIRTSATVGDGTVSSAGILMNDTGFYACQASQTLANANVKILINGSASFAGTITATAGKIGSATNYWSIGANGITATAGNGDVMINYGKTDFGQDATAGFILGYDFSVTKPKFEIGSSATKIFKYDGTDLTLNGGTITGGIIQTASGVGERIIITSTDNTINFYDSTNTLITQMGGGLSVARAIRLTLNDSTSQGIFVSSTVSGVGYYYLNDSDVINRGAYIFQTSNGTNNQQPCIELTHNGHTFAQIINATHSSGGIYIGNSGTNPSLYLNHSSTTPVIFINNTGGNSSIEIDGPNGNNSGHGIDLDYSANGYGISVNHTSANNMAGIYISNSSNSYTPALKIYHDTLGYAISIVHNKAISPSSGGGMYIYNHTSSTTAIGGIDFDLNNASTGLEYAFSFDGAEKVFAAVGGTQDAKIRVFVGGTTYYIPCYTT